MICIVDYGFGNLGSIKNMLKRIGVSSSIESDPDRILAASKLILPGVGAFDSAMRCINKTKDLREVLDRKALIERIPVLGICLGMQLLTNSSEEGGVPGLGWINAKTKRFSFDHSARMKVPHMGWNKARVQRTDALVEGLDSDYKFYFVHSYYVESDPKFSLMKTLYGHEFDSAICRDNIYGVQFHPEKSHKFGMRLLSNFVTQQHG